MNSEPPIYESRKTPAGLWQTYQVYRDRVELRTMVGYYRIPLAEIISIERMQPGVVGFWKKPRSMYGIKLDVSDFNEHVMIHRKNGLFKYVRFTPDDIDGFIAAVKSATSKLRR